ncbi:peptide methionine sulfoxide reductase [Paenibacillus hamazuiensis]|uniref:peptide methionine sulfoxide reductase n=1 Tax=Paenibacillus hamazuiensis TaxID=2936508 RepID=UPI00200EB798|nr:peptide methionine sulfoxide reductase [Paenibacillus hamazuiensis]
MGRGISQLANAINERVKKKSATPDIVDLGVIGEDGSLRLDRFGPSIPSSDYLVADWTVNASIPVESRVYRSASPVSSSGDDTPETTYSPLSRMDFVAGDDSSHIPTLELHFAKALRPGDRVLVLWVRDDPVIISKIASGNET